jgi:hypothetical protein
VQSVYQNGTMWTVGWAVNNKSTKIKTTIFRFSLQFCGTWRRVLQSLFCRNIVCHYQTTKHQISVGGNIFTFGEFRVLNLCEPWTFRLVARHLTAGFEPAISTDERPQGSACNSITYVKFNTNIFQQHFYVLTDASTRFGLKRWPSTREFVA